jgi:hypothetical protein
MLTAIISGDKQTKERQDSYFGRRWNAISRLHKELLGKGTYFSEEDNCSPTVQLSEDIIKRFQKKLPEGFVEFLNRMQRDSLAFVAEQTGMQLSEAQRLAAFNQSGCRLIRRIYDALDLCAIQLNGVLGFSGLHIASTAPKHVCEVTRYSRTREPLETITYYRARLATPSWTLVMRAREEHVEFFMLPVSKVMGFSRVENAYGPMVTLTATMEGNDVVWEIDQKTLTPERERELCMVLLRRLIELSKESIKQSGKRQFRTV